MIGQYTFLLLAIITFYLYGTQTFHLPIYLSMYLSIYLETGHMEY